MTSTVAMYGNVGPLDPMTAIQSVMKLRTLTFPIRSDHLANMKKIEPLLNASESSSNWRRGITGGNNTTLRGHGHGQSSSSSSKLNTMNSQGQVNVNSKWKSSTSSLNDMASPKADTRVYSMNPTNTNTSQQLSVSPTNPSSFKYESKFKTTEASIENTILNTIILNKLNKFSVSTYGDVRDFLYQILDSGEVNFTKEFMRLVFKKAAAEEIFCPLYAKLLSELRATYPIIQTEMAELFESYLIIFKDISNANPTDYQEFISKNLEKKYRLGYSQFLSELVILEAVDAKSLENTVDILISNIRTLATSPPSEEHTLEIQEYSDCLLRMTRVFRKKNGAFFIHMRKNLYEVVREKIEYILNEPREKFPSILPKSRFALMDVRDNLRDP